MNLQKNLSTEAGTVHVCNCAHKYVQDDIYATVSMSVFNVSFICDQTYYLRMYVQDTHKIITDNSLSNFG